MSFFSNPDSNEENRPWWAGSRPKWRSPWSFDEEEQVESPNAVEEEAKPPVVASPEAAPISRHPSIGRTRVSETEPLVVPKKREPERLVERVVAEVKAESGALEALDEPQVKERTEEVPETVERETRQEIKEIDEEAGHETDQEVDEEGSEEAGWNGEDIRSQYRRKVRRKRRGVKRVGTSWASLVLMAMAVLSLTFLAWLYVTDSDEVEDKDLIIATPPDLTPTITAPGRLAVFLGSVTAVPTTDLLGRSAWEWDTASMVNWLVQNSQALDNLKDLLEDADWHGRHASWHFADLGNHQNWAAALMLKQVEAAFLQRDGKHEAAVTAALDLAELARRLQDIHAWPSFYFRSLETHRRCTDTLAELLQRTLASEEALASFQQQFEACEPLDDQVKRNVLPGFYLYEKKRLMGIQSGEPIDTMPAGVQKPLPKQLFFKTNETLGIISNTIRHLVRQVGQTSVGTTALRDVWEGVSGSREVAVYQPNGRGVAYARRKLEPYLDVPARQQLSRTRHLLVVQLFAMRRFVAREKGLPQTLESLVPNYLKSRLADPFSGEAFQYDSNRGLIYSVGSDLEASGGRAHMAPLADPGEPTVKIGVQKAGGGN